MELQYRLMYRLGLTPWDRREPPAPLRRVVEGPAAIPAGLALDLGCGTGTDATYLAERGWNVTAVDVSSVAIDRARARSAAVHWHVADLTLPSATAVLSQLTNLVTLIVDVGCLPGLDEHGRSRWGEIVNLVSAPGAHLVIRNVPRRASRSLGPVGLGPDELQTILGPRWTTTPQPIDPDPRWHVSRLNR
jgi:SAM-dependent methyltransferase